MFWLDTLPFVSIYNDRGSVLSLRDNSGEITQAGI